MYQEDTITYQDHKVCTECKFHSSCKLFNPKSTCREDAKKNFDGTLFRIGNPLSPTIAEHGFIDWQRDKGRVTDGTIIGDSCNCEFSHYLEDASEETKDLQRYTVYPTFKMTNQEKLECKFCYNNYTKDEDECKTYCG